VRRGYCYYWKSSTDGLGGVVVVVIPNIQWWQRGNGVVIVSVPLAGPTGSVKDASGNSNNGTCTELHLYRVNRESQKF